MANSRRRQAVASEQAQEVPSEVAQEQSAPVGQEEASQNISIKIGRLGGEPEVVQGQLGMTVADALQSAGIVLNAERVMLRGTPVTQGFVLGNDDYIILAGNIRGGC